MYTLPRAIANGPNFYGGIAMQPLWVKQLVQQTQTIVKHLRSSGDCNSLFRIALYWAQINTGMGFHLLEHPAIWVPHFECKWLGSMRSGLADVQGSIECNKSFMVPKAREGDRYFMDSICDCKRFTRSQIRQINSCRIHLEVLLLLDIPTPCGQHIEPHYYHGTKSK